MLARAVFARHGQPRVPLCGYTHKSDAREMVRTIDAAAGGE